MTMLSSAWAKLTPAYVKLEAAKYPKCIAAIYLVGTPFGFSTAWNIIKPVLSKDQREMIKVPHLHNHTHTYTYGHTHTKHTHTHTSTHTKTYTERKT